MNFSNFSPSHHSVSVSDSESSSVQVALQVLNNSLFPEDIISIQEKTDDHTEDPKHTMQSLCKSFIKKYENTEIIFDPTTLANDFNAKLRRVYDMTNILEGGGIIQKVQKGIYKWNNSSNKDTYFHCEKNDWCSLRNISTQLKDLFHSIKKGITCHYVYDILTTGKKNKFNPATIRRRIYECCKVFLIAGLIQKAGKNFYNGKLTEKDIQLLAKKKIQPNLQDTNQIQNATKMINQQIQLNIFRKAPKSTENRSENKLKHVTKVQQERKSIIKKIVSEFKTQQDLYKFIEDLSYEFKLRSQSVEEEDSYDGKIDEQNEFLSLNNSSWQENRRVGILKRRESEETHLSPQKNRRTIIISSPLKEKGCFMFGPNSSFCSFPLNPIFASLQNIKPVFDIKGK